MIPALTTLAPLEAFLAPAPLVDSDHEAVAALARARFAALDPIAAADAVFLFVRDEIPHAWDIRAGRVTRSASDVLLHHQGICYAKSHLAAALLRAVGIPAGLTYQRLTLGDDAASGHVVHALNTVYLAPIERWVRFDARGNKPGVDARFSLGEEQLAFAIRPHEGEVDYLQNEPAPPAAIVAALAAHEDTTTMYRSGLPHALG